MADWQDVGKDKRTQAGFPKKLTSGLLSIAWGKGTSNPQLASIFMAQRINQRLGGAVVGPWDLGKLNDDWWDAFLALDTELPTMQQGMNKIEQRKAEIRANHPTYKTRH